MSIDGLIGKVGAKNQPFRKRYSVKQVESYIADLKRVIDRVKEGAQRPSYRDLQDFFLGQYGITLSRDTITRHMKLLEKGEEI